MIDFRYHALALTAVFVALTIGLLLGVTIGDQGLVSNAEHDLRKSLKSDVRQARAESADLKDQLQDEKDLQSKVYPLLAAQRLSGMRIGMVSIGDVSDQTIKEVRSALADSGGDLVSVVVIKPNLDLAKLGDKTGKAKFKDLDPENEELVQQLGKKVGVQYVRGSSSIKQIQRTLFDTSSGELGRIDSVILTNSTVKGKGQGVFDDALIEGIQDQATQVVGIESTDTNPSQIKWFTDRDITSVDDIDQFAGKVAFVLAMAGAEGSFGTKSTAKALLPRVASSRELEVGQSKEDK